MSKRQRHQSTLNKWILLLFAIGITLIGLSVIYFTASPVGYLILGLIMGFLADPMRNALESYWVQFAAEEIIETPTYTASAQRIQTVTPDVAVSEDPLTDLDPEADWVPPELPEHPLPVPVEPDQSLSAEVRQSLLQRTDHVVVNGKCKVCGYQSSLLDHYSYDPRFHYRECYVPELRSLVDQIILCPQRLIESHYQESEQ